MTAHGPDWWARTENIVKASAQAAADRGEIHSDDDDGNHTPETPRERLIEVGQQCCRDWIVSDAFDTSWGVIPFVLDLWTTEHRDDLLAALDAVPRTEQIRWHENGEGYDGTYSQIEESRLQELEAAEARAARYREALEAIANANYAHGWVPVMGIARRALSEEQSRDE